MNISTLSAPAARLLLVLLIAGHEGRQRQELMFLAGIKSDPTFWRAIAELRRAGAVEKAKGNSQLLIVNSQPLRQHSQPVIDDSQPVRAPLSVIDSQLSAIDSQVSVSESVSTTESPLSASESTLLGRIQKADVMPSGGDEHQRTSEFQARRQVQVALLIEAWPVVTGSPFALTKDYAKRMLSAADNIAEDVYEVMETCTQRSKASGKSIGPEYVLKTLEGRKSDREKPVPLKSVGVKQVQVSADPYEQSDWTGMAKSLEIQKKLERRGIRFS